MSEPDREHTNQVTWHPKRTEMLSILRGAAGGLVLSEISERTGLHPNTARWHLGHLIDAGLVRSSALHRGRPGRPRIVYEATVEHVPNRGYRLLAEFLASALAWSSSGVTDARAAGRAWGRELVDATIEPGSGSLDEAARRVRDLLDAHGFEPVVRSGGVVEMTQCPFHELVESYGDVVCTLHGGFVEGALEALGGSVVLDELTPYARPGVCVARLRPGR